MAFCHFHGIFDYWKKECQHKSRYIFTVLIYVVQSAVVTFAELISISSLIHMSVSHSVNVPVLLLCYMVLGQYLVVF